MNEKQNHWAVNAIKDKTKKMKVGLKMGKTYERFSKRACNEGLGKICSGFVA